MGNHAQPESIGSIDILRPSDWQMSFGDRAALEGVLTQINPSLAVEIGTAQGGSLRRIAAHSIEVHAIDLVPDLALSEEGLSNVVLHFGDSHELLPRMLAEFESEQRNVDFVLVDGDHSSEGARHDVEDLLASSSVGRSIILIHDTMNEEVRAGVDAVPYDAYPKVAYVDLDFIPGRMYREPSLRHELWGGFGLILVDSTRAGQLKRPVRQERHYEAFHMIRAVRDAVVEFGDDQLRTGTLRSLRHNLSATWEELEGTRSRPQSIDGFASSRLTVRLRVLRRRLRALIR